MFRFGSRLGWRLPGWGGCIVRDEASTDWLGFFGFLIAAGTFLFGVYQYRQSLIVQRRQFAADAMKSYRENPHVGVCMQILDWREREVVLPPEEDVEPITIRHSALVPAL